MIDPSIETELRAVLDDVPPVNHAFGYGSGVLPQPLRDDEGPSASARDHAAMGSVVDFVFAVDDPRAWHRRNMTMNPSHYAPHLRALGGGTVAALADRVGAGVHYNTLLSLIHI